MMLGEHGTVGKLVARWLKAFGILAAVLGVGLISGCGGSDAGQTAGVADGRVAGANALDEVLAADRAFAEAVAMNGLEAWVAAFDPEGTIIPPEGPVVGGHEAVRATMAEAFSTPGFEFVWEPLGGEVAASGDLAYTWGDYRYLVDSRVVHAGRYVTVWKRSDDGSWRVLADIGNRK